MEHAVSTDPSDGMARLSLGKVATDNFELILCQPLVPYSFLTVERDLPFIFMRIVTQR